MEIVKFASSSSLFAGRKKEGVAGYADDRGCASVIDRVVNKSIKARPTRLEQAEAIPSPKTRRREQGEEGEEEVVWECRM
jgi:hypothetical protein